MNEQTTQALKIAVERIVRPVRASIARKLKMREELLGHLTARYEEQYTRLHDEAAAVREAITRFGAPADLSRELQETVPRTERFRNNVDPCRPVGWNLWHVYRGIIFLEMAALGPAAMLPAVFGPGLGFQPDFARLVAMLPGILALAVLAGLVGTVQLWGQLLVYGTLYGLFGLRRSIGRATGVAGAMVVLTAPLWGLVLAGLFALSPRGVHLAAWFTLPLLLAFTLYLVLPMALMCTSTIVIGIILEGRPLRRTLPWQQLELD